MTSTAEASPVLADLVDGAAGRVVCLSMSKDPNAKVTLLLFRAGEAVPSQVAKVPTTDLAALTIQAEAAVLAGLGQMDLGPLAGTIPELRALADDRGRPVLVTTALPGRQMLAAYHSWRHTARPSAVGADFAAAGGWLAELAQRTCSGHADLATMLDSAAGVIERRFADDPATRADVDRLTGLRDELAGHLVPQVVVHNDFWPGNLLLAGGRVSGVIDWEGARLQGLAVRDVAHFALTYSLYLDRHTRPGRRVAGHRGLRAGLWGAGLDYAVGGAGWYPALVQRFVADGLERLGVPARLGRAVLLAEIACIAAEADHPDFARSHLLAYRRLSGARS
jgi:aminoglycoside phosphotransferase